MRRGLNGATEANASPVLPLNPFPPNAHAIDAYGFVPTSTVEDTPRTFDGGYTPRNAGGNTKYGTVTLREALSRSLNIATVDLADLIGTQALRTYAARFGIPLTAQDVNLSLALVLYRRRISGQSLCGILCVGQWRHAGGGSHYPQYQGCRWKGNLPCAQSYNASCGRLHSLYDHRYAKDRSQPGKRQGTVCLWYACSRQNRHSQ